MNFIRRLVGGDTQEKQVTLTPGSLRLVRDKLSPKGNQEYIFKEAELSLMSVDDNSQLMVGPLPEDDDADEAASSDASEAYEWLDVQRSFLVDESLKIGYFTRNQRTVVSWRDLDGDAGDRFEFTCGESVSEDALIRFDQACREAQFYRKYQRMPETTADLDQFDFDAEIFQVVQTKPEHLQSVLTPEQLTAESLETPEIAPDSNEAKTVTVDAPAASDSARDNSLTSSDSPAREGSISKPDAAKDVTAKPQPITAGKVLHQASAVLCYYDAASETFIVKENKADALILEVGAWRYLLEVRHGQEAILSVVVADGLSPYTNTENLAFLFNLVSPGNQAVTYLLKFPDSSSLAIFEERFAIVQWETHNERRWGDLGSAEQNYLFRAVGQMNLDDDEDMASEAEADDPEEEEEEQDEYQETSEFRGDKQTTRYERNSALEVGHANDRSYVVRGNNIGVFKSGDELEYSTTIENVVKPDGTEFTPTKLLLHESDRQLILQGKDDPESLYQMDLEYGKIIDEWQIGRNVASYAPVSKFAQTSPEEGLLGLGRNSLFRIDPRLSGNRVATDTDKIYFSNNGFSALATTEQGYVAVGGQDGSVRLYNKLGIQAKTSLPSLGDKIIGIDVTSDGHWVLATFKSYLLLIEAVTPDINGFTKAYPKDKKPRPRRIQISPENAAFMFQETRKPLSFTPARFDMGPDAKEQSIITSTGPYVITWNLRGVLRNQPNPYLIKRYQSLVTADNFKYGSDKRVVVALEDNVGMVAKSALRKPTRKSLKE